VSVIVLFFLSIWHWTCGILCNLFYNSLLPPTQHRKILLWDQCNHKGFCKGVFNTLIFIRMYSLYGEDSLWQFHIGLYCTLVVLPPHHLFRCKGVFIRNVKEVTIKSQEFWQPIGTRKIKEKDSLLQRLEETEPYSQF
jgi:hypothetical protein